MKWTAFDHTSDGLLICPKVPCALSAAAIKVGPASGWAQAALSSGSFFALALLQL